MYIGAEYDFGSSTIIRGTGSLVHTDALRTLYIAYNEQQVRVYGVVCASRPAHAPCDMLPLVNAVVVLHFIHTHTLPRSDKVMCACGGL